MKPFAAVILALATPAPAMAQEPQQVVNVYSVAAGEPMPETRIARGRFFLQQELVAEVGVRPGTGIRFDLTPGELDALRNRHDMHDGQPFVLAEWIAVPPGGTPRHLDFLHCSLRIRTFVGMVGACLRDGDDDGRLDGAATFVAGRIPPEGLQFTPIDPVGYHYARQPAAARDTRRSFDASLALSYQFDRGSNRLRFVVNSVGLPLAFFSAPSAEVDPAQLPVTFELGGAAVTVLAWDGRRATLRADRPFPASLVRIFVEGRAWRLDYYDLPLPGEPPRR